MSTGGFGLGPFGDTSFGLAAVDPSLPSSGKGWGILLNGVYIDGGLSWSDVQMTAPCTGEAPLEIGCLTAPPDGLGLPELRTEDVTFPQRDGVRHFRDWYEPRIITLSVVVGPDQVCTGCSPRQAVQQLIQAWRRHCDDTELVIFTDCHGEDCGTPWAGPYGIPGRPRQAPLTWSASNRRSARLTLRFDAVDHRMYVLDCCGTPFGGEKCVDLLPNVTLNCRDYPKCYDTDGRWCYDVEGGDSGNDAIATNEGTECACMTLTLTGTLTNPTIENTTTGDKISYEGTIPAGSTVIIDGENGTATQDGVSRTHLLSGNTSFCLAPGENRLVLTSFGQSDDGSVTACWRDVVVSA